MGRERDSSDRALDRHAGDLERDGICILRGLPDPDLLREWAAAFAALVERRRNIPGGLAPRGPGRYYVTLPWTEPFADQGVFAHPGILGVIDRVFAQEYAMVQLAVDTPVLGSDYQETHRDHRPLFTEEFQTPLFALAINFPLCPVDEENGPFQVARGTPNRTDRPRPMVVMGYVMHWLRTAKVDLEVPRNFYDTLGGRERDLLRCRVVEDAGSDRAESYVEFKY